LRKFAKRFLIVVVAVAPPYRPHATLGQLSRSYPRSGEFFAEKRRLDLDEVFSNQFYLDCGHPPEP